MNEVDNDEDFEETTVPIDPPGPAILDSAGILAKAWVCPTTKLT
jgi:hypothetical protein